MCLVTERPRPMDSEEISVSQYNHLPKKEQKKYVFKVLDEQFRVGGEEDVDLFLRIFSIGYRMVMSGHSCFWHKEGATRWNDEVRPGFRERNKEIEQKNYDRFAAKWGYDIRTQGLRFFERVLE